MKVSRNFVKVFLALFLIVVVANIVAPFFNVWNSYYLLTLCVFTISLFFLIYRKKDNGTVKFFKFLILLVPVLIIGFIFYSNFIASQEFNYYYDIGSEQDASKSYLSPLNRISDADFNESYRNMTSQLVYFDSLVPRGSDTITVRARLLVPSENYTISLGAKNKEEWSYFSKPIYNSLLDSLNISSEFTRLNPEMPEISSLEEIPSGSVVATDKDIRVVGRIYDFELKPFETTQYLRESHTFFIYLRDSLELQVEKQDINWYEGEDVLNISLKDLNGTVLGSSFISDDGVINKSKEKVNSGKASLNVSGLSEGVYVLELKGNSDTVITRLELNTHKIVSNRIFSADSANYLRGEDKEALFYTETSKNQLVSFQTYHAPYLQNVSVGGSILELQERAVKHYKELNSGKFFLSIPRSNIIIESSSYLTFSEENYFEPFEFIITTIPSTQQELGKIDYLITDYKSSQQDGDWRIFETSFEMKDLYIKDGKLSLMFNVPHLAESQEDTNQDFVKVDWIDITIKKDGIL